MYLDMELEKFATKRQWEKLLSWKKHGTQQLAADDLGISRSSVKNALIQVKKNASHRGYAPEYGMNHPAADGYKVKGMSTLYDSQTGKAKIQWVKTDQDKERQLEMMQEAIKGFSDDLPKLAPQRIIDQQYSDDLMSVIPFGDPHFGMLSWAKETGNDFNLEIAKHDLCAAVHHLVSLSPTSKRCVIANLGDFFHADNLQGTTSRSGNVLDLDSRMPKIIQVGMSAMRQAITTALTRHETVEVVNAIGNHDDMLSMTLSICLANIYENEPRVIIHDAPTPRHYIVHGKVLLGITHGHRVKDANLPLVMATEQSAAWGLSKHRYFYRGHQHHDTVQEFNGCKVEQFRTLAPGDAYAVGGGYLSGQDMKLIVHHKEYGEVSRNTCSIDMVK